MALHAVLVSDAQPETRQAHAVPVNPETHADLIPVRTLLRATRATARLDGEAVCAMVGCGVAQRRETLAAALMQLLHESWGQFPVIFHPTAKSASFDEVWLITLAGAHKAGDAESMAFLLGSRLPRHAHRMILTLLTELAF